MHRKPEFILMLTYNDSTVKDALNIFRECKDAPVMHWGFKDVGLPPDEIKALVDGMKAVGKTTYLEVVSLSEEEGLRGAWLRFGMPVHGDLLLAVLCLTRNSPPMTPSWRMRWPFVIGSKKPILQNSIGI